MCDSDISSHRLDRSGEHSQVGTNRPGVQRRGWLKRAKKVGFATSADHVELRDQRDMRIGTSLLHIIAGADNKKEDSSEYGKVDTRGYHNKQIRVARPDSM